MALTERSPLKSGSSSSMPDLQNDVGVRTRKRKIDSDHFSDFCKEMKQMFLEFQKNQESKIDGLTKSMEELTLQNKKLLNSNNELQIILQRHKEEQAVIKKKVDTLETEYSAAHVKIDKLENQIEGLEREQLKNIIEIRNVPKDENETPQEMVRNLFKVLNILEYDCVSEVYRQGKENAPIIIKVKQFEDKIKILKEVRLYNIKNKESKLNSRDLGLKSAPATPIYVSENLSKRTKSTLSKAKKLVDDGMYKYCWVRNGFVMLRKADGEPAIRLDSTKGLETLQRGERSD